MRPHIIALIVSMIIFTSLLTACDQSDTGGKKLQMSYRIELGGDVFDVPTEYLLNAKNRKDGSQRYVVIVANIPDLLPIEDALTYMRPPNATENTISFDLNYGDGKVAGPDSLLRDWAANQKNSTVILPAEYTDDGLIHLGAYKPGGTWANDIYAVVRDGTPVAQISCAQPREGIVPMCRVYQRYRDYMGLIVDFRASRLQWYANEGMQKVLDKVEGWRVK